MKENKEDPHIFFKDLDLLYHLGGLVKPGSGRGSGSGNGGVKPGFPGTGSKYTEH